MIHINLQYSLCNNLVNLCLLIFVHVERSHMYALSLVSVVINYLDFIVWVVQKNARIDRICWIIYKVQLVRIVSSLLLELNFVCIVIHLDTNCVSFGEFECLNQ